jgi:site-specific recombinase XerC
MTVLQVLDAAGRRRSPATMPGFHRGRPPRNKGVQYPADPPTVEEIVAVMRYAGDQQHGLRSRALIVLLWRAGLRISETLSLAESDLDPSRGSVLVRHGKGGKPREVGMDQWAWQHLNAWLEIRSDYESVRCCASSTGRPRGDRGHPPPRERRYGSSP